MTKTAYEILDFNFSFAHLQHTTANPIPSHLVKSIDSRLNRIKNISEKIGISQYTLSNGNLIPQVFSKTKNILKTDISLLDGLESRELRTLAYSLTYSEPNNPSIFSLLNELELILLALKLRWKNSFLLGLIDCYLKNWESKHKASVEKLADIIYDKLKHFEGERTVLKSLKTNIKYFDYKKGNLELGYALVLNDVSIKKAAEYISLPNNWFSYSYFSLVIVAYYEKRKKDIPQFIDEVEIALKAHNNFVTNQRIVSRLILQANTNEYAGIQEKVKSIAFNFIGDPEKASVKWNPYDELSEKEKKDLENSKAILNQWIIRRFISVFFEKCINDYDRKMFWLKVAPKITSFKIIGPRYIKDSLMRDERISEFVNDSRFSSTQYGHVSALLMVVKDYILIEFSESGHAFYAYKLSNANAPQLNIRYSTVNELRDGEMPMLIYADGREYSEGRLTHRDIGYRTWQRIFADWLRDNVGINV